MKSVNRRDFLKLSGSTVIGLTLGGVASVSYTHLTLPTIE